MAACGFPWGSLKADLSGSKDATKHWAFRPLPLSNAFGDESRRDGYRGIDAFIERALSSKKLTFSPEAKRRTLIRRLYFDLVGLPPDAREMEDALADDGPDAWLRLVDRLLASPAYGEKWGREWLDIARYARLLSGLRTWGPPGCIGIG